MMGEPILDELAFCDLTIVNSVFSLYMLHVNSCVHMQFGKLDNHS